MKSQDTPEVPEASSISNTKPALAELMARFAEIEVSYLPFHIEYSETGDLIEGPYNADQQAKSKRRFQHLTQRGHQSQNVWMCESTNENEGVSRTERLLWQGSKLHRKETLSESRFFGDDYDESIERSVRPLEGIFPLLFGTKSAIRVSDHFAAAPSEFTLEWREELARVMCHYRPKNDKHIAVELWLEPDYGWHPVFMRRYEIHTGERFPDEWKALQFLRLADQVRISLGDFNGPIRGGKVSTDEFSPPFIRSRFEILKSAYQNRVAAAAFSPETPIGGSPITELEPVGGEQVEVKSSNIAELSPPALTPEQMLALAAVTNQQSATEMRPAAAVNTTSTLLVEEIQAKVAILEAERAKLGAKFPNDHIAIRRLDDQLSAFRNLFAGDTKHVISVLNLQHAEAGKTSRRLQSLFPEIATLIVADEQTNSLLLRCDAEHHRMIEDIASSIDDVASTSAALQEIKSYTLKHISAAEAQRIIVELYGDDGTTISANQQGNVLLARGVPTRLAEIEAILLRLEDQSIDLATLENSVPKATISGSVPSPAAPKPISEEPAVSIAEHRRRMIDLEKPVVQLAEKVRAAETSLGKDHPNAVMQRAELRVLVQKTFAERQEIQRSELAEFTRRLQHMQRSIETREKIADKIVDRRVEVLLNPDVDWGDSISTASPPKSTDDMGRDQATSDLEEVPPLHPQEPFPIDSPLEERPSVSRSVPENRAQLGQCMDALVRDVDEFEDRTKPKPLMEFKDQPVLQITDDFKAAVSSLRKQVELDAPRAKLEECFAPVSQHGAAFVQAWSNVKSQPAKVVLNEIADDIVSLERCIRSLDFRARDGGKLNSAPEPLAVKQNGAELEADKETVSLTLFEVTDAKFMPSDDTNVRQTAAPSGFDDQLANMLKNKTAKVIGKHTIGMTGNQLATLHSGGKFEVPSSSPGKKAEVVFGTTIEITPRTLNSERVFQILWSERVRNFENAVSGIPGIDEKRIELDVTSPLPGSPGYLIEPAKGKNQPRRLFIHFLLEASPNVAARTQPPVEAIQIRLRCNHRMSLDSGDVVFADDGRVAIVSRMLGIPMGFNFVEGDHRGPYQLTFERNDSSEEAQTWLKNHVLPVEFLAEDQERAASGQLVAKVIYLKSGSTTAETLHASQIETISSHNIEAGVDPVSVAAEKGTVIGVVKISQGAIRSVASDDDILPAKNSP